MCLGDKLISKEAAHAVLVEHAFRVDRFKTEIAKRARAILRALPAIRARRRRRLIMPPAHISSRRPGWADNVKMRPGYLAHVRDKANGYLSIHFGEDVELSQKL